MMKRNKSKRSIFGMGLIFGMALLMSGGVGWAQETAPAPPPAPMLMLQAGRLGEPGGGPGFGGPIELLGFGGLHGGKVVKGAPFSAIAVSESTQVLADGTHITRKTQTTLYRDGEGRFRKEVTMPAIGPLAASGATTQSFIAISDPVAGVEYVLEPEHKIARKLSAPGGGMNYKMKERVKERMAGHEWKSKEEANVKNESLGTQSVNGISAEGTRVTHTIAAGEIGNDKPISIVSERWYSPDLQIVVMSKRNDPRFGDATYTLTNIQRQEPPATFFTVPADYTVTEGGPEKRMRRTGPPAPAVPPPGE